MVGPNLCCIPSFSRPVGYRVVLSRVYRGLVAKWAPCPCRGYGVGHGHVDCGKRASPQRRKQYCTNKSNYGAVEVDVPFGEEAWGLPFLYPGIRFGRRPHSERFVSGQNSKTLLPTYSTLFSFTLPGFSARCVMNLFSRSFWGKKHVMFCSVCVFLGMFWCFILSRCH